ncbi:16S rRNA (guanine(966)-N(2))-methyltransferase RsmD [Fusibacter tunisiensis]
MISGSARGIKLLTMDGLQTRPTTDRVKESIFNMLQTYIFDSRCLDLFSGSGALGIEMLSRGARQCVFVDSNLEAIRCIRENLKKTKLDHQAETVCKNATQFVETYDGEAFDFVFLDPPYFQNLILKNVLELERRNLITNDTFIVVEYGTGDPEIDALKEYFKVYREKTYGKISVIILRRQDENSSISR